MALLSTPVEKAERRLADIQADLANLRTRLGPDLDFDESFALREEVALLERKEAAAVDALAYAHDQEAKAAAEAGKAKAAAEIDAYRREAERDMPSRFKRLEKHLEGTRAELAAIDSHVRRLASINKLAEQFGLPRVVDGEMLFRSKAPRVVPAVYEERDVWKDGHGRSPSVFRTAANGELVPSEAGYIKSRERVLVSAERRQGGGLPGGRIADAIELTDLAGHRLWPAR